MSIRARWQAPTRGHCHFANISPHMLARANQRVFSEGLRNCSLCLMDAQNMSFVDGFFDKVAAMYIASVVPNPQDMVSEMKRVCKPGGDLLIVNHFSNCNRLIRAFETILSPLASIIGFRPVFSMDEFILGQLTECCRDHSG